MTTTKRTKWQIIAFVRVKFLVIDTMFSSSNIV